MVTPGRFTQAEKIKALKRELDMRKVVYPRRVRDHIMTQADADYQIAIMKAILEDYQPEL